MLLCCVWLNRETHNHPSTRFGEPFEIDGDQSYVPHYCGLSTLFTVRIRIYTRNEMKHMDSECKHIGTTTHVYTDTATSDACSCGEGRRDFLWVCVGARECIELLKVFVKVLRNGGKINSKWHLLHWRTEWLLCLHCTERRPHVAYIVMALATGWLPSPKRAYQFSHKYTHKHIL